MLSGLLSSAPPERKGEELRQEARIECVRLMGRKKGRGKEEGRLAKWSYSSPPPPLNKIAILSHFCKKKCGRGK